MSEFSTEIGHPLNVLLTIDLVVGIWVVSLAKRLALFKSLEDQVHWDLSLKDLVWRANALDGYRSLLVVIFCVISLVCCHEGTSNISEAATDFTVAEVRVLHVG